MWFLTIFKALTPKRIAIILAILLLLYAIFQTYRAERLKEEKEYAETERDQALTFATSNKKVTDYYISRANELVAVTETQELSEDNLKALINTQELSWIKKFDRLDKKYKQLGSAHSFDFTMEGEGIPIVPVNIDTISKAPKFFKWELKDQYNNISAIVLDTPVFHVNVPVYTIMEWERKHHFIFKKWRYGKKEWFQQTFSPNKLVKLDSQSVFTIKRKE